MSLIEFIMEKSKTRLWLLLRLSFIVLIFNGCRSVNEIGGPGFKLEPFASTGIAEMSAEQIVEVGRRAGLNRQEILNHGTEIRNALAVYGGCRIYQNNRVRLIMAVHDKLLYVSMDSGANFIYKVNPNEN